MNLDGFIRKMKNDFDTYRSSNAKQGPYYTGCDLESALLFYDQEIQSLLQDEIPEWIDRTSQVL